MVRLGPVPPRKGHRRKRDYTKIHYRKWTIQDTYWHPSLRCDSSKMSPLSWFENKWD